MANSLYLDTNVYLSFYHLSNEDLEELEKLSLLTIQKEITLYLPEQTINEFNRNRDAKISDALMRFNENKLNNVFPQITKDYEDEFKSMREAIKSFEKNKQTILDKMKEDIAKKELKADIIIQKLFNNSKIIKTTTKLLESARLRFDLGNPPGKNNSYGDALNWESLLHSVEDFDNFFFISDDKDYYSVLDKESFNTFLLEEWKDRSFLTTFKHYKSLSRFFKDNYPNINIATEIEKENLINALANSRNFAETRRVLRLLHTYDDFTRKQLNDILNTSISNNQIYWIAEDDDIDGFLKSIFNGKYNLLDQDYLYEFKLRFPDRKNINDSLPF